MTTNGNSTFSRKLALALIICAVFGTEISYHLTLESRFNTIEEKLQQDTVAMQQMQDSIDTLTAAKTQTASDLNKQLATLQSSFEPLGKTSQAQASSLAQLRQQITTLQQAQGGQQDAQKKLSDYIALLEENVKKARAEAEAAAAKPAPAPAPAPVAAPNPPSSASVAPQTVQPDPLPAPSTAASDLMSSPGAVSHGASLAPVPMPFPRGKVPIARAPANDDAAMELRPADSTTSNTDTSRAVRAFPVGSSLSSKN